MIIKAKSREYSMYGTNKNAYKILINKSKGMKPLGIHRYRWKDNIKINMTSEWGLDEDRDQLLAFFLNTVMNEISGFYDEVYEDGCLLSCSAV